MICFITNNLTAQTCPAVTIGKGKVHQHGAVVKSDGTLFTWGYNNYGEKGNGIVGNDNPSNTYAANATFYQIGTAEWSTVSTGVQYSVAIKTNGTLWAWGRNNFGQIGNNMSGATNVTSPTQISSAITDWVSVTCGNNFTVAIRSDGTLWGWGRSARNQMGGSFNGMPTSSVYSNVLVPTQIGIANNWTGAKISVGSAHVTAIKADGSLWTWGSGNKGECGRFAPKYDGDVPGTVTGTWISVSAGDSATLAVRSDGTLWGWGWNNTGKLGDGTTDNQAYPKQIGTDADWATVSFSNDHALAVKTNGTLWGWGANGDAKSSGTGFVAPPGTYPARPTPTQIGTASNWSSVSAASQSSFAVKLDGSVWSWGTNWTGQAGRGNINYTYTPTEIATYSPELATTNQTRTASLETYINYPFADGCGLIASVMGNGSAPISGSTTAKVWVETVQPTIFTNGAFIKRHYEITPANNATTATGRVTLYATQEEFDDFNALSDVDLPVDPMDASGIANLLVEKRSGTSSDNSGLPASYAGTSVDINPIDANIKWDDAHNKWEITFETTGFSGFWIKTIAGPLSLKPSVNGGNTNNVQDINVAIYPNPFASTLKINSAKAQTVYMVDMFGRNVKAIQLNTGVNTISTQQLASGTYIIRAANGNSYKIIKQ
jgi:alpha-tubulin suppressor-like RCC1 family protein